MLELLIGYHTEWQSMTSDMSITCQSPGKAFPMRSWWIIRIQDILDEGSLCPLTRKSRDQNMTNTWPRERRMLRCQYLNKVSVDSWCLGKHAPYHNSPRLCHPDSPCSGHRGWNLEHTDRCRTEEGSHRIQPREDRCSWSCYLKNKIRCQHCRVVISEVRCQHIHPFALSSMRLYRTAGRSHGMPMKDRKWKKRLKIKIVIYWRCSRKRSVLRQLRKWSQCQSTEPRHSTHGP